MNGVNNMAFNIGGNIKKLRAEKGVTQEQLAEHLSITYQSVSKWENSITSPDLYLIPAIAEYFEVTIDELFQPNMQGYKNKAARLFAFYEHRPSKQHYEKADAEFEKLIAENKADADDYRNYGMLNQFRAQKLNQKAEDFYKKSIEMGNEKSEGQLRWLLESLGRHQENIDKYEEAVKNDPNNARNWYLLAYSYGGDYGDGVNPEKALDICRAGLKKFPDDAALLSQCGDFCRGLKKHDEAIGYYHKSIELNPDTGDSYYGMAFVCAEAGKYKEAIWAWEEVIALYGRLGLSDEEAEMGREWPRKEIAKLQKLINE